MHGCKVATSPAPLTPPPSPAQMAGLVTEQAPDQLVFKLRQVPTATAKQELVNNATVEDFAFGQVPLTDSE